MKKLFYFLFLFIITNTLFSQNTKTFKIAISSDSKPYSFIDKNGDKRGIFIDYWKLWSKKSGHKIEFVSSSWSDSLKAIKNKTVHIHSGLFKNDKRLEYIKYLNKIYNIKSSIYVFKDSKHTINTTNDLNNLTMGVIKDTFYNGYLKKYFSNIKLKTYISYQELYEGINNKDIDAFIDDDLVLWRNVIRKFDDNPFKKINDFQLNNWFYVGIIKSDEELEKIVIEGINKITKDDLIKLEEKWIINKELRSSSNAKENRILNEKESNYLNVNKTIILATLKKSKGYSYRNENNELVGLHVDLVKIMNKNLKINIKIKSYNTWKEAYENSKNNLVDGIFYLSWSKEREKYFIYTDAYKFSPFKIIVKDNEVNIKKIKDFNKKTIAVINKSITNTTINRLAPKSNLIPYDNAHQMYQALYEGKVDAAMLTTIVHKDKLKKLNLKVINDIFVKEGELYIGVNKKRPIIASVIKKALNSISKEEIRNLQNKWFTKKVQNIFTNEEVSYIKKSKKLKVGVDFWEPIEFSKDNISFDGIAGDIFKRISEISGLEFEVHVDKWHKLLDKLKNKEIDILPAVVQTSNRDKFALFTQKYLTNKSSIFVNNLNTNIKSFKDLNGKKLAILKSLAATKEIKKRYPKIDIIEKENLSELITLVQNNEVSAFFALEINSKIKLKESLVNNIKIVYQNEITNLNLKIASKKDDLILHNILKKSLYFISHIEKNKIISKWLNDYESHNSVNIAVNSEVEPYLLNKSNLKGIEYDLLKLILSKNKIKITSYKTTNNNNTNKTFKDNNEIDILLNVDSKKDKYFYSKDLISKQNVVISRKKDNLKIISINNLKDKVVVAYKGANKDLSKLFGIDYQNKIKSYKEITSQEKIIIDFLNKRTDIIIVDKNVFQWHLKKHSNVNLKLFKLHYIYSKNQNTKIAFKDSYLRDTFNATLKEIQQSGEYQKVLSSYLEEELLLKNKLSLFISSILAKPQFLYDTKEINNIIKIFASLDYINKIEVYSNKLLASSSNKSYKKFTRQNSHYLEFNSLNDVGFIKVYFNDEKLKEAKENINFVPDIKKFENLNSFLHIKDIYKQFNYLKKELQLTNKEKNFIKRNPIIKYSALNWEPLTILDNNEINGLLYDYMKIIEEKTSLSFKFVEIKKWNNILNSFKNKEIDFIPSSPNSLEYKKLGILSKEYENFNYSIVTREEGSFISKIQSLKGKTLAIPTFYEPYKYIKENFPNIKLIGTKNIKEALTLVSNKKADAFIGHEVVSVFYIKKYFPNLKIVGLSDKKFRHHFLISKEKKQLSSIINKVLDSISYEEKRRIRNKWIKKKINLAVDYTVIYQIIAIFIVILLIVFYFIQKLRYATKEIQEQKINFEKLFNEASDGLLIMKDFKYTQCNTAALELLKIKEKEKLINTTPSDISPALQPDGSNSKKKIRSFVNLLNKTGRTTFEWVHIKSTNEHCWLEITLTKIILNNEEVIYVVWRDINNRKLLESQIKNRNKELEDSNLELETTLENLKQTQEQLIDSEKMASLGALVAGVAHEINTPIGIGLTGITHLEQLTKDINEKYIEETMSEEFFEDYLKTSKNLNKLIYTNLNKAAQLVKSFKQVAVDQSSEQKRVFNLNNYMNEILHSIHSITKKTNIAINFNCAKTIEINSFPGSFSQIITNLIMNSIIHGFEKQEKGEINISLKKEDETLKIIYKDNGIGIKKENLNKIFDPFFTTNRENGGSGLGLNIIYNIITSKLNGSITCISEENIGVEFIIIIKT